MEPWICMLRFEKFKTLGEEMEFCYNEKDEKTKGKTC